MEPILVLLFISGAIAGSFLNVVIYRMPRGQSLISPGSRCPRCGYPLSFHDNIPIVSYLLLRGRCRRCKTPISPRYPLVEFSVAMGFLANYMLWGFSLKFVAFSLFFMLLLAATLIDLDFMRIPNPLTLGGLILGILLSGLSGFVPLKLSILGAMTGGILLLTMRLLGRLVFKREPLGFGDVKFLSSIGAFLGPLGAVITLFLGSLWGTLMVPLLVLGGKERGRVIPFGPFLSLGALSFLYYGTFLMRMIGS